MSKFATILGASILSALGFLAVLLVLPILAFVFGFLGGLGLEWLLGNAVVQGASIVHITITNDQIPYLTGILALIGSYLRTKTTVNNKIKKTN